jgi:hypothetical protein
MSGKDARLPACNGKGGLSQRDSVRKPGFVLALKPGFFFALKIMFFELIMSIFGLFSQPAV